MVKMLPVFPLKLVVFPREKLNLHIFEPRYKQLINDCWSQQTTFGIPLIEEGKLRPIGTEIRILSIDKCYPKGEMDIKTEAVGTFDLRHFFDKTEKKLYASAQVESRKVKEDNGDFMSQSILMDKLKELFRLMEVDKALPPYVSDFLTFDYAHYVGFSVTQEYEFLTLEDEQERQTYMRAHLRAILPTVREMRSLKERAALNGHFKHIVPPKF
jgi:ATP-dependent Lon protease